MIAAGSRLGPYEILGPLGAGGMGEVYRARDGKLGRDVAIKVLPEQLAADPERLARFEREARLLAAFGHANIAAIHGLGEAEDRHFLVMELVSGETLADRIAAGAIPVPEALEIARQVAEGIEAAHEKGIIHRDLKPSNVMVSPDGRVKLLDFGLAKAVEGETESEDAASLSRSPTISERMTGTGIILGTAAYMSPEQARGKPVDRRTDIWAFGVLLFEMLAGRRLFTGETVSDTLAAILRADIPWDLLPAETPAPIRRLLARCLERDPKNRLHDAADARIELSEVIAERRAGSSSTGILPAGLTEAGQPRRRWAYAVAGAAVLAVVSLAAWRLGRSGVSVRAEAASPIHSVIPLPAGTRLAGWASPVVAISRDGRKLAYVATKEGSLQQLYVHHLDRGETQLVPDSETAEGPFFSPDGNWVAFATDTSSMRAGIGQLKKFSLASGLTQSICRIPDYFGGDWSENGTIAFVGLEQGGIWTVPAAGGTPAPAAASIKVKGQDSPRGVLWPQHLPGGRLLVTDEDASRWGDVGVLDLRNRELRYLLSSAFSGRYIPTGHLLYLDSLGTLFAMPFDPLRAEKTGAPVAALKDVTVSAGLSGAFAVSDSGTLVYATGYVRDSGRELATFVRVDRAGAVASLPLEAGLYARYPRLSPDGRRLATIAADYTLWIYDLQRNTGSKLPGGSVIPLEFPVWTPDSERIAFGGSLEGSPGWKIFWQKADGSAQAEPLIEKGSAERHPASFTPDGHALVYTSFGEEGERGLWIQPIGEKSAPRRLMSGSAHYAALSPGGRWLAYASAEAGSFVDIFAEKFPELGRKVQISVGGGTQPVWSRDGRELFYRKGNAFYAVSIAEGPELTVGSPKLLFEKAGLQGYDAAPDGKSFVAVFRPPEFGVIRELHLVTNWFEELKRLSPVRGEK